MRQPCKEEGRNGTQSVCGTTEGKARCVYCKKAQENGQNGTTGSIARGQCINTSVRRGHAEAGPRFLVVKEEGS